MMLSTAIHGSFPATMLSALGGYPEYCEAKLRNEGRQSATFGPREAARV